MWEKSRESRTTVDLTRIPTRGPRNRDDRFGDTTAPTASESQSDTPPPKQGVLERLDIDQEDIEEVAEKAKKGLGRLGRLARKGLEKGAELATHGIEAA